MRVIVAFLLAALQCCSLSEGRLVSKCDLREELMMAIGDLPERAKQKGLTVENLVAKIVCHVESTSGFDTSVVNQLTPEMVDRPRRPSPRKGAKRRTRRDTFEDLFSLAEQEDEPVTDQPHTRDRRQAGQGAPSNRPKPPNRPPQRGVEVWTLYGLFQLSNHLVCSDNTTRSPNLCGMDCSNFVDDDVHDDISCLLRVFTELVEKGFGAPAGLRNMVRRVFQEDCRDKEASDYFTEC